MQQKSIAQLNAYIEEMINGQKVIKVFCREKNTITKLHKKNEIWAQNAIKANAQANSIMPIINALGYIQYVTIAIIGAYMAMANIKNFSFGSAQIITIGMIASFLTLSRNFINPISQIANQFNSIVTALAGAERIFNFMHEEIETDKGLYYFKTNK